MARYVQDDYDFPADVNKLMNLDSIHISENKRKVIEKNPDAYVISWMEVASCCWTYMQTHYSTRGIFPPNIMIDRKNKPETEHMITGAAMNIAWRFWRDEKGKASNLFPSYCELRVYHKNIMGIIRKMIGHDIPEMAMLTYMTNTFMHEYIHYLDYYDKSYDVDLARDGIGDTSYLESVDIMDNYLFKKDTVENEHKTERQAILNTMQYLGWSQTDEHTDLEIIPGGPFDLFRRKIFSEKYTLMSIMCEIMWIDMQVDFETENGSDKETELLTHKWELVDELKKYQKKNKKKMIIID